eukprot:jgi/Chrpa1/222/Chrysochromulina_OHIO_Genome00012991-RA
MSHIIALDFRGRVKFVRELVRLCDDARSSGICGGVSIVIKNGSCSTYTGWMGTSCEEISDNSGRNIGTALAYIVQHYDNLPTSLVFVPASAKRYRFERAKYLLHLPQRELRRGSNGFDCATQMLPARLRSAYFGLETHGTAAQRGAATHVSETPCEGMHTLGGAALPRITFASCRRFRIWSWNGSEAFVSASPAPFRYWVDTQLFSYSHLSKHRVCFDGVFRTTRELLLLRSRAFYEAMLAQVSVSDQNEVSYYIERAAQAVFGGAEATRPRHSDRVNRSRFRRFNRFSRCNRRGHSRFDGLALGLLLAPPVRIVWLWWAQGWHAASPLVRACAASWERENPTWQVRRLSLANLTQHAEAHMALLAYGHLPETSHPLYADILRTELLVAYGGLWADATLYCVQGAEVWLARALAGASGDFWAPHRTKDGEYEVSIYLLYARVPRALVPLQMSYNLRRFWAMPHVISRTNVFDPNYFMWMQTFGCLVQRSSRFRHEYERLGTQSLPDGDQVVQHFEPHQYCLRRMALSAVDRRVIERGPVFKLSHKTREPARLSPGVCSGSPGSNLSQPHTISVYDYFLTRRASTADGRLKVESGMPHGMPA